MYTIEIDYTHGDSYHSERSKETIEEFSWNLETAKINLQRIKEHYQAYNYRNGYVSCMAGKKEKQLLEDIQKKPWFVSIDDMEYKGIFDPWTSNVKLLEDDGTSKVYYTGKWTGYFETLHGASIVKTEETTDDDLSFQF